MQFQLQLTKDS